jgi:hypothetical protein
MSAIFDKATLHTLVVRFDLINIVQVRHPSFCVTG